MVSKPTPCFCIYTAIRGQILLMNPLPSLNQAYSLLLQDENQRDTSSSQPVSIENTTMSVRHFQRNVKNTFKSQLKPLGKSVDFLSTCTYCHQDKHTRD